MLEAYKALEQELVETYKEQCLKERGLRLNAPQWALGLPINTGTNSNGSIKWSVSNGNGWVVLLGWDKAMQLWVQSHGQELQLLRHVTAVRERYALKGWRVL